MGHIKFFARLPHGGYLRAKDQPTLSGRLEVKCGRHLCPTADVTKCLAYGLPLQEAQQIMRQVGAAAAAEAGENGDLQHRLTISIYEEIRREEER